MNLSYLIWTFQLCGMIYILNERTFDKRAQWSKATLQDIDRYKCMLNDQLSNIKMPLNALHCDNVLCNVHNEELNTYCARIIEACLSSSDDSIPSTRKKVWLAGKSRHSLLVMKPFSGTSYGWTTVDIYMVMLLILGDVYVTSINKLLNN